MTKEIENIMARLRVLLGSAEQAADFICITERFIATLKRGDENAE